jgi:hypothetical protein
VTPEEALVPQPSPLVGNGDVALAMLQDKVVPAVLKPYIEFRRAQGIAKYGTPLGWYDGRNMGSETVQEMMDLYIYAYKAQHTCKSAHVQGMMEAVRLDMAVHLTRFLRLPPEAFEQYEVEEK